jgi:hypothetical protein
MRNRANSYNNTNLYMTSFLGFSGVINYACAQTRSSAHPLLKNNNNHRINPGINELFLRPHCSRSQNKSSWAAAQCSAPLAHPIRRSPIPHPTNAATSRSRTVKDSAHAQIMTAAAQNITIHRSRSQPSFWCGAFSSAWRF